MNADKAQTEVKNDIAATKRVIDETKHAILACTNPEDSWLLKQLYTQLTQLTTQLTQLTTQLTLLYEKERDITHLQPSSSAPPPQQQPAETGYVTAYLSPRKLEFVWTKLWSGKFPRGMKTGLKSIAKERSGIKFRVQHTSPRMVERKAQHSVVFTAWGELPTLQALREEITSYANSIGCTVPCVQIIPDISYQPENAECDIVTSCGTLVSDGSGKEHEEQASTSKPVSADREIKSADTRSFAQKRLMTEEQAKTVTDTITKFSELSVKASELAKSIASPETSDRIAHDFTDTLRRELPPKKFIRVMIDGVLRVVFGVVPIKELSPISDIAWDLQYYLYPQVSTGDIKLQAYVLDRAVGLDEAAINVTHVEMSSPPVAKS